jgi:hypothetical protein
MIDLDSYFLEKATTSSGITFHLEAILHAQLYRGGQFYWWTKLKDPVKKPLSWLNPNIFKSIYMFLII